MSNEPITISFDTHLTLKVEGVITHGSNPGLYRHVQAILLSVSSNQQSRAHTANDTKVRIPKPTEQSAHCQRHKGTYPQTNRAERTLPTTQRCVSPNQHSRAHTANGTKVRIPKPTEQSAHCQRHKGTYPQTNRAECKLPTTQRYVSSNQQSRAHTANDTKVCIPKPTERTLPMTQRYVSPNQQSAHCQ